MAQPSLEMLASMPDKPPLPKKPRAPKRVASEADNAVRQAEHTRAVAEYERQMELHRILMHERKTQQMATRRAQLAAAEPLDARRATHDAPGLPAHSTEPAAVTVALPVAPPKRVRRVWNGNSRPRVHSHEPRTSLAMRPDGRHPAWARWADDVERIAGRCGVYDAQTLYPFGLWYDPQHFQERFPDDDELYEYRAADRHRQFERLEGLGEPPTAAELEGLPWPQCQWWADRDRIVLLCEFIWDLDEYPPEALPIGWQRQPPSLRGEGYAYPREGYDDGWYAQVEARALSLWSGPQVNGAVFHSDDPYSYRSPTAVMAGYRYLTSLPSCPRPMRIRIAPALYARRFDKSSVLPVDYCWPQPSIWPPWAYCPQTAAGLPRLPYVAPSPPMTAPDALLLRPPPSPPSEAELTTEMASSEEPRPVTTEDLTLTLQAPPCADFLAPDSILGPLFWTKEACERREREHAFRHRYFSYRPMIYDTGYMEPRLYGTGFLKNPVPYTERPVLCTLVARQPGTTPRIQLTLTVYVEPSGYGF